MTNVFVDTFKREHKETIPTSRNTFFKGKPPACQLMYGRCVVCLGRSTSVTTSGGSTSMFTSGGVHFHVHFQGGSHVNYPIMLLYTAIECPSASWTKFTWDFRDHFWGHFCDHFWGSLVTYPTMKTNTTENITFPHYVVGSNNPPPTTPT